VDIWTVDNVTSTDVLRVDLASTASGKGAALVGINDAGDYFPSSVTQVEAALQNLGASRRATINVADYPWLCDMTGATDSTMKMRTVELAAIAANAAVFIPSGTLVAAIATRRNNVVYKGAGIYATEVRMPLTSWSITSISRSGAGIVTVNGPDTTKLWVGLTVKVQGVSDVTFNDGYEILSITGPTSFTGTRDGISVTPATVGAGGLVLYGNVFDAGQFCLGNVATAYTGLEVTGMTLNGMRASRLAPSSDITDWGLSLTKTSKMSIDVRAIDCHNAGVGAVINSNYGSIWAIVENCGNVTYTGAGFDINSSKWLLLNIVSKDCYDGARVLDNCWGVVGNITVNNATRHGFTANNQASNQSYNNNLQVSVDTCGQTGVIIGENVRSCMFDLTITNAGDIGVNITDASIPANRPSGNDITAVTRNSQNAGMFSYADDCQIKHTSRDDGRSGAAGTWFSLDVNGNRSTYISAVSNTGVAQARGMVVRASATSNQVLSVSENNLVSGFQDNGTQTRLRGWLMGSATYDPPNLVDGAGATTTVTVTGAALGDMVTVSASIDVQGITVTGYVSSANTVSVRYQNETGGAIDLVSHTLSARVMKALG